MSRQTELLLSALTIQPKSEYRHIFPAGYRHFRLLSLEEQNILEVFGYQGRRQRKPQRGEGERRNRGVSQLSTFGPSISQKQSKSLKHTRESETYQIVEGFAP